MSEFLYSMGARVKERRKALKMSQDELASLVGYKDRSTISRFENGEFDITIEKIESFANALGVEPSYLMGWIDEEQVAQFDATKDAELLTLFHQLSADQQDSVLNLIKSMNK